MSLGFKRLMTASAVPRSKACDRSIFGIAGSNPAEGKDVSWHMFIVCCVGSDLCDELITHSEEFYRVSVSNFVCSRNVSNEAARFQLGSCGHGLKKILPGGLLGDFISVFFV